MTVRITYLLLHKVLHESYQRMISQSMLIQSVVQMATAIYMYIHISARAKLQKKNPNNNKKKKSSLKISNKCGQVSLWQKCDIFFSYIKKGQRMWECDRERTRSYQTAPDQQGLSLSWKHAGLPVTSLAHGAPAPAAWAHGGEPITHPTRAGKCLGEPQLQVSLSWKDVASAINPAWLDVHCPRYLIG